MYLNATIVDNILSLENANCNYKAVFEGWGVGIQKVITKNNELLAKLLIEKSILRDIGYRVVFENGKSLNLSYKGFFNPKQVFEFQGDKYEIFPHRGNTSSIFKNGTQIAYWTTTVFNSFNKSSIDIYTDQDVNKDLLFIFICAFDFDFEDEAYTANINFGNLFQARRFDENWKPKEL